MKILLVKKKQPRHGCCNLCHNLHQPPFSAHGCRNLHSTTNMPRGRPQKYANNEERKAGNRARVQKYRQKKNNEANMQTQLDGLGRPDTAERTSERLGVRVEDMEIPAS